MRKGTRFKFTVKSRKTKDLPQDALSKPQNPQKKIKRRNSKLAEYKKDQNYGVISKQKIEEVKIQSRRRSSLNFDQFKKKIQKEKKIEEAFNQKDSEEKFHTNDLSIEEQVEESVQQSISKELTPRNTSPKRETTAKEEIYLESVKKIQPEEISEEIPSKKISKEKSVETSKKKIPRDLKVPLEVVEFDIEQVKSLNEVSNEERFLELFNCIVRKLFNNLAKELKKIKSEKPKHLNNLYKIIKSFVQEWNDLMAQNYKDHQKESSNKYGGYMVRPNMEETLEKEKFEIFEKLKKKIEVLLDHYENLRTGIESLEDYNYIQNKLEEFSEEEIHNFPTGIVKKLRQDSSLTKNLKKTFEVVLNQVRTDLTLVL